MVKWHQGPVLPDMVRGSHNIRPPTRPYKTPRKIKIITLQEMSIAHLGKRKIIFISALSGGYGNSLEGTAGQFIIV